jgi:hypothetical protein
MVSVFSPCLLQRRAGFNRLSNIFFNFLDSPSQIQDLALVFAGNHNNSVCVTDHKITGRDRRIAERYDFLRTANANPVFPCPHVAASTEEWIFKFEDAVYIAAHTIDHSPREITAGGCGGEQVTPDGNVSPPPVVQHYHGARLKIVNEISDRSAAPAGGCKTHSEGSAAELEVWRKRLDAMGLSGD